jgi:glycosyltransferase involved in cell wall biosynthesis
LKILLLNYSDSNGGAAIAVYRLFNALRKFGIVTDLGVIEKKLPDTSIFYIKKNGVRYFYTIKVINIFKLLLAKIILYVKKIFKIEFKTSNMIFHSENKKTLLDIDFINDSDYDLIHFHWINYNMISIEDIAKIKKPVVWTLHDSWVFCGAEHHPNILENDNRFITGYYRDNKPITTRGQDICRKTWERKIKSWKNCNFTFISPSNYEKRLLEESALFHNAVCEVMPNIVPDTIFRPLDKAMLRTIFNIPKHSKVIGFGSAYTINEKSLKGEHLLIDMLQMIEKTDDFHCVIMGNTDRSFIEKIAISVFTTGFISNPYILAAFYNVCDVFVCPSIIENLPNVCLESLFCGVPVVTFRTGGIPDIVEHKTTGYLAEPFDAEDLYRGIQYCLDNFSELSRASLQKSKNDFNAETIINKHIELYEKVLIPAKQAL